MEAVAIGELITTFGPGTAIAALSLFFAWQKDKQCTALMERLAIIAEKNAVANEGVKSALIAVRDAIQVGTRS